MSATVTDETGVETEVGVRVAATGKKVRPYQLTTTAEVWGDVLKNLGETEDAAIRNGVDKAIHATGYDGTFEDDEEITINPTEKFLTPTVTALRFLGLEVDLESATPPEKTTSPNGTVKGPKEPTYCVHCGEVTGGGKWNPGHDMKMRGQLTRIVDNTNLGDNDTQVAGEGSRAESYTPSEAIARLVTIGWYSEDELNERRNKAFKKVADAAAAKEAAKEAAAKAKAEKAAEPAAA